MSEPWIPKFRRPFPAEPTDIFDLPALPPPANRRVSRRGAALARLAAELGLIALLIPGAFGYAVALYKRGPWGTSALVTLLVWSVFTVWYHLRRVWP